MYVEVLYEDEHLQELFADLLSYRLHQEKLDVLPHDPELEQVSNWLTDKYDQTGNILMSAVLSRYTAAALSSILKTAEKYLQFTGSQYYINRVQIPMKDAAQGDEGAVSVDPEPSALRQEILTTAEYNSSHSTPL